MPASTADRRVVTRMTNHDGPAAGYATLLSALLDTRADEATARFDAQLDAALATNRIDATTARALRWWQRASVRSVESYLTTAFPALMALRHEADARAAAEAADAATSWARASRSLPSSLAEPAETTEPAEPERPVRFRLVAQTESVRAALAAAAEAPATRPDDGPADGGERARPATPA